MSCRRSKFPTTRWPPNKAFDSQIPLCEGPSTIRWEALFFCLCGKPRTSHGACHARPALSASKTVAPAGKCVNYERVPCAKERVCRHEPEFVDKAAGSRQLRIKPGSVWRRKPANAETRRITAPLMTRCLARWVKRLRYYAVRRRPPAGIGDANKGGRSV
jgi:hypothetical protein